MRCFLGWEMATLQPFWGDCRGGFPRTPLPFLVLLRFRGGVSLWLQCRRRVVRVYRYEADDGRELLPLWRGLSCVPGSVRSPPWFPDSVCSSLASSASIFFSCCAHSFANSMPSRKVASMVSASSFGSVTAFSVASFWTLRCARLNLGLGLGSAAFVMSIGGDNF